MRSILNSLQKNLEAEISLSRKKFFEKLNISEERKMSMFSKGIILSEEAHSIGYFIIFQIDVYY